MYEYYVYHCILHACTRYRPSSVVCLSVGRSVTVVSTAKTPEPIEMTFGLWTRIGPKEACVNLHGVTSRATWRKRLNRRVRRRCGLFVKLL